MKNGCHIKEYTRRKNLFLVLHDFVIYAFILSLGMFFVSSGIWYMAFIVVVFLSSLLSIFLFRSITVFENRVVLKQHLLGEQVLDVEQIQSVGLNSTGFFLFPVFRQKNNFLRQFYFVVSILPYADCYELVETVNDLVEENLGK